jgi:hypothetical protein
VQAVTILYFSRNPPIIVSYLQGYARVARVTHGEMLDAVPL